MINAPRPFIRNKTYFGPDRRRAGNVQNSYHGPERRAGAIAEAEAKAESGAAAEGEVAKDGVGAA